MDSLQVPSKARFGENNPNWRGGKTKANCLDCGVSISKYHKRCKSCSRKGELHPNYRGGPRKCPDCGESAIALVASRCLKCWHKFMAGENNPSWKGGLPKCKDCGKTLGNWTATRCGECYHKYAVQEKSYLWKGGITIAHKLLRSTRQNAKWSAAVRERDGFKCRVCGEIKKRPEAHHIIPFSFYMKILRKRNKDADNKMIIAMAKQYKPIWDISNGVTLCRKCHMMVHGGLIPCPDNLSEPKILTT